MGWHNEQVTNTILANSMLSDYGGSIRNTVDAWVEKKKNLLLPAVLLILRQRIWLNLGGVCLEDFYAPYRQPLVQ